jgi:hypothetical protein
MSAWYVDNLNEDYRDEAQIDEDHRDTRPQLLKDISDNDLSCTKNKSSQIKATKRQQQRRHEDEQRVDA